MKNKTREAELEVERERANHLDGLVIKLQSQLAAEREKSEAWRVEAVDERIISKQLREHLAAATREALIIKAMTKELREQLAAERGKAESVRKWYLERIDALNKVNDGLSAQLAAERQKVKWAEHQRDKWEQIAEELEASRDKLESQLHAMKTGEAEGEQ